jgi:hypothetical protein
MFTKQTSSRHQVVITPHNTLQKILISDVQDLYACKMECIHRPTKRALDGWDSARFLEIVLNDGSFPFTSLVLASRQ